MTTSSRAGVEGLPKGAESVGMVVEAARIMEVAAEIVEVVAQIGVEVPQIGAEVEQIGAVMVFPDGMAGVLDRRKTGLLPVRVERAVAVAGGRQRTVRAVEDDRTSIDRVVAEDIRTSAVETVLPLVAAIVQTWAAAAIGPEWPVTIVRERMVEIVREALTAIGPRLPTTDPELEVPIVPALVTAIVPAPEAATDLASVTETAPGLATIGPESGMGVTLDVLESATEP